MSVIDKSLANADEATEEQSLISERLVAARANANALSDFPGLLPETLRDAYTIQSTSIQRWPDEIGGWKVGLIQDVFRESLGAERLAGPIFRSSIFNIEPNTKKSMPIFDGGFAAVEAELVLQLAATIEPTRRDYSDEELVDLVAAMYVGAEIASSPMAMVNKLGPCSIASDFGNNAGLLVGPNVPNWSSLDLDSMTATVSVDDVPVGTATARALPGGPLHVLRYLVGVSADRGITLAKGTLISTGALTGIHDVTVGSKARVDFGSYGAFDVVFEPIRPTK